MTVLTSIMVPQDVDLTSYHLCGKNAALGIWCGDRPVVLEEWANESTVLYLCESSCHGYRIKFALRLILGHPHLSVFRNGCSL
jgi:hypothetical protein